MLKQFAIASLIGMAATAAVCASIKPPTFAATAPTSACLPYNQTVTLTGKLKIVGHHVDPAGIDVPAYYLLHLDRPICTLAYDDMDTAESNVTEMQLWDFYAKAPIGKPVQVTGKMWHAQTLHNRTDVIFDEVSVQ